MPWVVSVVWEKTPLDDWRPGFFPRRFHYKKDAERLKREVESVGGKATVSKQPKDGSPGPKPVAELFRF